MKQQCTLYQETASPDSNGHALKAETCYGLLNGPAEVSGFFFFFFFFFLLFTETSFKERLLTMFAIVCQVFR